MVSYKTLIDPVDPLNHTISSTLRTLKVVSTSTLSHARCSLASRLCPRFPRFRCCAHFYPPYWARSVALTDVTLSIIAACVIATTSCNVTVDDYCLMDVWQCVFLSAFILLTMLLSLILLHAMVHFRPAWILLYIVLKIGVMACRCLEIGILALSMLLSRTGYENPATGEKNALPSNVESVSHLRTLHWVTLWVYAAQLCWDGICVWCAHRTRILFEHIAMKRLESEARHGKPVTDDTGAAFRRPTDFTESPTAEIFGLHGYMGPATGGFDEFGGNSSGVGKSLQTQYDHYQLHHPDSMGGPKAKVHNGPDTTTAEDQGCYESQEVAIFGNGDGKDGSGLAQQAGAILGQFGGRKGDYSPPPLDPNCNLAQSETYRAPPQPQIYHFATQQTSCALTGYEGFSVL